MKTEILEDILAQIRRVRGLDFSQYRRSTLTRRLADRMARLGVDRPDDYLNRICTDAHEVDRLVDAIAINVSAFFRDPLVFHVLAEIVIPRILKDTRQGRGDPGRPQEDGPPERAGMPAVPGARPTWPPGAGRMPAVPGARPSWPPEAGRMPAVQDERRRSGFRVWSAGCAMGEEPYSVAMLLHELSARRKEPIEALIFATDIDRAALAAAEKASYAREQLRNAPLGILDKYFDARGDRFCLKEDLKRMVRFSLHDLVSGSTRHPPESVFGDFDLILCRNLLIYFSDELQQQVLVKLCDALVPGGVLVLGQAEELTENVREVMVVEDRGCRIFRRR